MSAVQTAFDAYRSDLRASGRTRLGADDARWLLVASALEQARDRQARDRTVASRRRSGRAGVRAVGATARSGDVSDGGPPATLLAVLRPAASPERPDGPPADAGALLEAVVEVAREAEAAGALSFAAWLLAAGSEQFPDAPPAARALATVLRARVARKRGDLAHADDLYVAASAHARRGNVAGILAQAALGRGVVARVRGDYPSARRAFVVGVRRARRAGRRDLEGAGHQGLLIAAAAARDYATALAHGWAALRLAEGDANAEADALGNLAAVAGDLGDHRAAIRGYLAAAARVTTARVRLPALAGAAASAGAAGEAALVAQLDATLGPDLDAEALPYETATGYALLARAWRAVGDQDRASTYVGRARALADRHGFHELAMTLDAAPAVSTDAAPAVTDGGRSRPDGPAHIGTRADDRRAHPAGPRGAVVLDRLARVPVGREWGAFTATAAT